MSDPADKSDDLIAELARLMAVDDKPAVPKPAASIAPSATPGFEPATPRPIPVVRIPGMDSAAPSAATAAPPQQPQPAVRAPVTGTIRIPGMDQPAPVSTSAPVSKFDFGRPVSAPTIPQEPLPTLAERIAARAAEAGPAQAPAPTEAARSGFDLRPVSENKSFAEGPALTVGRPAAPQSAPAPVVNPLTQQSANDFTFDFGFAKNPPAASPPVRPTPSADPIADLIAADAAEELVATPKPAAQSPIPLKPVNPPPRPSEDRFATSPGTGINMRVQGGQPLATPQVRAPEPATPPPSDDPMAEIENLIGEAVRVELTPAAPVRVQAPEPIPTPVHYEQPEAEAELVQPAPVSKATPPIVPPLGSPYAPRRSSLKDDKGTAAAEDAILAAAATSGAKVNRVEPSVGDESPYRRLRVKPQRASAMSSGVRQYVGMAVAGTLLLAAGLGLYWVLNMGAADSVGNDAPQLTADATPVKEAAPSAPAADSDTARSPVLEQLDGASAAPDSEQLVATDDQVALSTADAATPRDVTDDTEGGLANRKVRTVTVRPDGTIVSGDDSVAGTEELPVDRPDVPDVPGSDSPSLLGTDRLVAGTDLAPTLSSTDPSATSSVLPLQTATADSSVQPVFNSGVVAPRPISFPVRSTASSAEESSDFGTPSNSVNALVGAQTPNGQIDLLAGGDPTPVAAAPRVTASTGGAAAYVQMASMPSEAEAQAQARTLTNAYGGLFGGADLIVQEADLGSMGVRYRVRLPTSSLNDATRICAEIKASGGDCFATSG